MTRPLRPNGRELPVAARLAGFAAVLALAFAAAFGAGRLVDPVLAGGERAGSTHEQAAVSS